MIEQIVAALSDKRFRYVDEAMLHEGMSVALLAAGISFEHEVPVAGGRIDFIVDRVGIEVKIKGGLTPLLRQVERYATNDHLDEFLVVTTQPAHTALPDQIGGKPVRTMWIGGFGL